MIALFPVLIQTWNHHGIAVQHAFHSAIPELWAEAQTPEHALLQLAERLALSLEYARDEFHREPIRRAIDDVNRLLTTTTTSPSLITLPCE